MIYTIVTDPQKLWIAINTKTGATYGQPVGTPQEAQALVAEAEAKASLRRASECARGRCSI